MIFTISNAAQIQSYDSNPLYRTNAVTYTRQSDGRIKPSKETERKSKQVVTCRPNVKWNPKVNEVKTIVEFAAQLLNRAPLEKWPTGLVPSQWRNDNRSITLYSILAPIANSGFDVTAWAPDWIAIAGIMAGTFNEDGREMFHDISRNYPYYSKSECDEKYDEFVLSESYSYAIDTIRKIAQHYGFINN